MSWSAGLPNHISANVRLRTLHRRVAYETAHSTQFHPHRRAQLPPQLLARLEAAFRRADTPASQRVRLRVMHLVGILRMPGDRLPDVGQHGAVEAGRRLRREPALPMPAAMVTAAPAMVATAKATKKEPFSAIRLEIRHKGWGIVDLNVARRLAYRCVGSLTGTRTPDYARGGRGDRCGDDSRDCSCSKQRGDVFQSGSHDHRIHGKNPYIGKLSTNGGASFICALPGDIHSLPAFVVVHFCG
jgi:hypothetical protein